MIEDNPKIEVLNGRRYAVEAFLCGVSPEELLANSLSLTESIPCSIPFKVGIIGRCKEEIRNRSYLSTKGE